MTLQVTRSSWRISSSDAGRSFPGRTAGVGLLSTKRRLRPTRPSWSSRSKVRTLPVSCATTPPHETGAPTPSCPPGSGCGSLESRTRRGQTPLHLAVEGGLMENASFLLQRGAEADSEDQDQDTPLLLGRSSPKAHVPSLRTPWLK